jgi:hypothetical protein
MISHDLTSKFASKSLISFPMSSLITSTGFAITGYIQRFTLSDGCTSPHSMEFIDRHFVFCQQKKSRPVREPTPSQGAGVRSNSDCCCSASPDFVTYGFSRLPRSFTANSPFCFIQGFSRDHKSG